MQLTGVLQSIGICLRQVDLTASSQSLCYCFHWYWEVADFIPVPQIANVKAKLQAIPYFEFILLGVIFVFVLIATIRHGYAHSDGTTINFREYGIKVGISAGVIFAYLGVIAAAAPRVLDKLGIKIGNK